MLSCQPSLWLVKCLYLSWLNFNGFKSYTWLWWDIILKVWELYRPIYISNWVPILCWLVDILGLRFWMVLILFRIMDCITNSRVLDSSICIFNILWFLNFHDSVPCNNFMFRDVRFLSILRFLWMLLRWNGLSTLRSAPELRHLNRLIFVWGLMVLTHLDWLILMSLFKANYFWVLNPLISIVWLMVLWHLDWLVNMG